MTTLIFLISIVFIVYSLISIAYFKLKKNHLKAKTRLVWLLLWVSVYAILLFGFSLSSKSHILAFNEDKCFDDWCVAVVEVSQKPVGKQDADYFVKLRVSSKAKRVTQRPDHPNIFFIDSNGKYDESNTAKLEFEKVNGIQKPIDSLMQPQGSFNTFMVFRIPTGSSNKHLVINEGSFPVQLIIGDEESLLYKDTIFQITSD